VTGVGIGVETGLQQLRRQVQERGLDRRPTTRVLAELAVHLCLSLGGIAVFIAADHWAVCALALLVSTAGSVGVGSNTHTSSHGATSGRRWVNDALTYFGSPFYFGVSATYWWDKHMSGHHRAPNVVGADPDIEFIPWFALNQDELAGAHGWRHVYHRHLQWLVFPVALAFNLFNMQKDGWRFVLSRLSDPRRRDAAHWFDAGAMGLHLLVFVGLPMLYFPVLDVLAFTVLRWALYGYAMFAVLAPAHWPAQARFRSPAVECTRADRIGQQLESTLNFRTGRVGRFFCSGLDYQIEHHLFPGVSHVHYPALQPLVQAYCEQRGLPYRTLGWGTSLRDSFAVLRRPKPVESADPVSGLSPT
jgi:linoleoyl-CoA desaturase